LLRNLLHATIGSHCLTRMGGAFALRAIRQSLGFLQRRRRVMRRHGLAVFLFFTLIGALVVLSSTFSIDSASTTTLLWDFTPTAFSYLPNVQKRYQPPTPTPTPTSTPTFPVVCTPPPCEEDEVYYCPGECPGGCGTVCATPTPTNTPTLPPPSFDNCSEPGSCAA
jgi:hypothetical protein